MILPDSTVADMTMSVSTKPRSVLKNKEAVQQETIDRSPFRKDWKDSTETNTILNEIIAKELPDEQIHRVNRTSTKHPNRKRILIQEQANTVRTIPRDNNGRYHQKKRYSTEPTWLDRFKTQGSDKEFTEAFDEADETYPGPDMHLWLQTLRS